MIVIRFEVTIDAGRPGADDLFRHRIHFWGQQEKSFQKLPKNVIVDTLIKVVVKINQ